MRFIQLDKKQKMYEQKYKITILKGLLKNAWDRRITNFMVEMTPAPNPASVADFVS